MKFVYRLPPTDLALLEHIYRRYYTVFVEKAADRATKVYVPIDIRSIAVHFKVDPEIVFGQLYYHLEPKHASVASNGTAQPFFTKVAGSDKDCIHFTKLGSIVAAMRSEKTREQLSFWLSIVSLVVAIVAIGFSSS